MTYSGATSFPAPIGRYSYRANGPAVLTYVIGDETTAVTTGNAKLTVRAPFAFTLTGARASVTTAPTGSALIVDVDLNGASVLSAANAQKINIDAGAKTSLTSANQPVIVTPTIPNDGELTFDIVQIGATIAGAGLKVYLIGTR